MYRTLMVYLEVDRRQTDLVDIAISQAERFSASLIGLSAAALLPPLVTADVIVDDGRQDDADRNLEALASKAEWFLTLAKRRIGRAQWRSGLEQPSRFLSHQARAADLIVMKPAFSDPLRQAMSGDVVIGAGRPVLLVPESVRELKAERIVIAWKNTREARRAVADAMPFLQRAADVSLVQIGKYDEEGSTLADLEDVKVFLERHDVQCGCEFIVARDGSDCDRLLEVVEQTKADLIVSGAYSHSRLREMVLGGMTRELLFNSRTCCLMSH